MIGIVVMCGVALATVITLFAVPAAYALFARNTQPPGTVSRQLDAELAQ